MKPFDLERALAGDPVVTRDGGKVLEIVKLSSITLYRVIVVIEKECKYTGLYTTSGIHISREPSYELFMAPTKKTYWVNIASTSTGLTIIDELFKSKEEALINNDHFLPHWVYHSTVPVEIEE